MRAASTGSKASERGSTAIFGRPGAQHPFVELGGRHRARLLRQQVGFEVGAELLGGDALERELVEVAVQEFVDGLAPKREPSQLTNSAPLMYGTCVKTSSGSRPRRSMASTWSAGGSVASSLRSVVRSSISSIASRAVAVNRAA